MEADLNEKLGQLIYNLGSMSSLAVAFSGGVDSSLLLKVAQGVLNRNVLAVIVDSPTLPRRELHDAVNFVKEMKVRYHVIETDNLLIEGFTDNPVNRCYLCKQDLFSRIKKITVDNNFEWVADGSNFDDLGDDRPGMKALKELGVISPLLEADLTKDDIRQLAQRMQIKTWDKPAAACLASRFAYGQKISLEKLRKVEEAEAYLSDLGFKQIRVRSYDNDARIEVFPEERVKFGDQQLMDAINDKLRELGFAHVSLDLGGYRSGGAEDIYKEE
ncbi:MAG TPA: ATP-dependent sacrificial sulfur transferase LarE [Syntrophomonas sp.]|nr:ATP-dependent sacrificial sulfur transferase LarE [Syntrophomonas sp.]